MNISSKSVLLIIFGPVAYYLVYLLLVSAAGGASSSPHYFHIVIYGLWLVWVIAIFFLYIVDVMQRESEYNQLPGPLSIIALIIFLLPIILNLVAKIITLVSDQIASGILKYKWHLTGTLLTIYFLAILGHFLYEIPRISRKLKEA